MEEITITKDGQIIARHTTASCLSHYGQPVWVVETEDPGPGLANWSQGDNKQEIEIVEVKAGWLIVRQPDGYLCGIIWSDGSYYSEILEDSETKEPCNTLQDHGQRIRGTVQFDPTAPDDLGAILL